MFGGSWQSATQHSFQAPGAQFSGHLQQPLEQQHLQQQQQQHPQYQVQIVNPSSGLSMEQRPAVMDSGQFQLQGIQVQLPMAPAQQAAPEPRFVLHASTPAPAQMQQPSSSSSQPAFQQPFQRPQQQQQFRQQVQLQPLLQQQQQPQQLSLQIQIPASSLLQQQQQQGGMQQQLSFGVQASPSAVTVVGDNSFHTRQAQQQQQQQVVYPQRQFNTQQPRQPQLQLQNAGMPQIQLQLQPMSASAQPQAHQLQQQQLQQPQNFQGQNLQLESQLQLLSLYQSQGQPDNSAALVLNQRVPVSQRQQQQPQQQVQMQVQVPVQFQPQFQLQPQPPPPQQQQQQQQPQQIQLQLHLQPQLQQPAQMQHHPQVVIPTAVLPSPGQPLLRLQQHRGSDNPQDIPFHILPSPAPSPGVNRLPQTMAALAGKLNWTNSPYSPAQADQAFAALQTPSTPGRLTGVQVTQLLEELHLEQYIPTMVDAGYGDIGAMYELGYVSIHFRFFL